MPPKGYKLSEESKRKISVNRTKVGKVKCICEYCNGEFERYPAEIRKGGGVYCCREHQDLDRIGKPIPEETLQKRSEKLKGRTITPEWREKLSLARKGYRWSEEDKKKMSEQRKGKVFGKRKPLSEDHKRKLSIAFSGRKITKQHRNKISESLKGIDHDYKWRMREVESKVGGFWYGNIRYYNGPQYCEKFNENFRERVRAFFNYTCVECGELQNGRKLHVHHIHYNKSGCCDNSPRRFVALCGKCHMKTNSNREYWEDHFADIIDAYYGGESWLTKEEYSQLTNKL